MKKAFTMIELVFVIVIIGILAAVAIPKLAATRDDATIANIIANTRTALGDMGSHYTSQSSVGWENNTSVSIVTNVPFRGTSCTALIDANQSYISPNTFTLCDDEGNPCVTFSTTTGGNVAIATVTTGSICSTVATESSIVALTKDHQLGGKSVER